MRRSLLSLFVLSVVVLTGCSGTETPPKPEPGPDAKIVDPTAKAKYVLKAEPAGARGIGELRQNAKDGEEVAIVGRVGGNGEPFTGKASFTVVDLSLEPCDDDGCGNPWCETDKKELKQKVVLVRFTDDKGETLPFDAEQSLGLKICQTVVIHGRVSKPTEGNVSFVATGVYPRP